MLLVMTTSNNRCDPETGHEHTSPIKSPKNRRENRREKLAMGALYIMCLLLSIELLLYPCE
jgi:hypothetical protein